MPIRIDARRLVLVGIAIVALLIGAGLVAVSAAWNEVNRVSITRPASESTPPERNSPDTQAAPTNRSSPVSRVTSSSTVPNTEHRPEADADRGASEARGSSSSTPSDHDDATSPSTAMGTPRSTEQEESSSITAAMEPSDARPVELVESPEVVLLVGSDSREGLDDLGAFGDFGGARADVMLVAFVTSDRLSVLSIPRDLVVENRCTGGLHRIGDAIAGCGGVTGLGNLVATIEALLDVRIDHVASIDMAGFRHAVDRLGGYEICLEHPLRDAKANLRLDAGCTVASGQTTLAYLRSRHTERFVDGRWEAVPAVSDLVRNQRQREFMLDLFDRLGSETSLGDLLMISSDIAPYLTVDEQFSFLDMARLAWSVRKLEPQTISIPVVYVRVDGASMLEATTDPAAIAAELVGAAEQ